MIHFLGSLSLIGYLTLAYLGADGNPERIAWGLAVWLLLFLVYGWLARRTLQRTSHTNTDKASGSRAQDTPIRTTSFFKATLFWALLFRIALLPAGLPTQDSSEHLHLDLGQQEAGYQIFLLWDNDVWRYLWEGHVVTQGISPYRLSPAEILSAADQSEPWAEQLVEEGPWLDVLDRVSYPEYRSVYPPLALSLFTVSHGLLPGSVLIWKLLVTTLEFAGCLLFAALLARTGRPTDLTLLLAWNPLLIKEVAGSGHVDGVLLTLLVAVLLLHTLGRKTLAIVALTAAILVKLWPILFVPSVLLRSRWKAWWPLPVGLTIGYWPYRHDLQELLRALRAFSEEWVFNPGPWLLIEQASHALGAVARAVPDLAHLTLTLGAVAATSWLVLRRRMHPGRSGTPGNSPELCNSQKLRSSTVCGTSKLASDWYLVGAIFLLFSATVMPWYLIALLPVAILLGSWPWLVATAAMLLSYGIYFDGKERGWVLAIEFSIITAAFIWAHGRSRFTDATSKPTAATGR